MHRLVHLAELRSWCGLIVHRVWQSCVYCTVVKRREKEKEKQLIMIQRELIGETKYLVAVFRVPALAIKRQSIYRHTATEMWLWKVA